MGAFLKSFICAFRGIFASIKSQRNMRFHLCTSIYVICFSSFYSFSLLEYCIIFAAIAFVISLELLNTAIEITIDAISPRWNIFAGMAKDAAAGAVLVASLAAAVCGFLLFWNVKKIKIIYSFFLSKPLLLGLFILSLLFSFAFVFYFENIFTKKKEKK